MSEISSIKFNDPAYGDVMMDPDMKALTFTLEYYRGVFLLTTNRDYAFDEAICSRITMFLCYEKHTKH